MTVFIIYFILLTVLWAANFINDNSKRRLKNLKRTTVILLGGYLFFIAAFRDATVGLDTRAYVDFFYNMKWYSWIEIFQNYKEFGYFGMNKLILIFTNDYQVLFVVIAAIFAIGTTRFIYKYSDDVCLSFLILTTLNFYYFSLCTLRQSIAMAILMFSLPYIIERKPVKFLLVLALAATFHTTSLVFILGYLLANTKITKKYLLIVFVMIVGALAFRNQLTVLLKLFYPAYGGRQSGASAMTLFLYLAVEVLAIIFVNEILNKEKKSKVFYNLSFLALIFEVFALSLDVVFRIAMYFSMFYIVFIPKIFKSISDKRVGVLVYIGFVTLVLVAYFGFTYDNAGVYPYKFCWE